MLPDYYKRTVLVMLLHIMMQRFTLIFFVSISFGHSNISSLSHTNSVLAAAAAAVVAAALVLVLVLLQLMNAELVRAVLVVKVLVDFVRFC